MNNTLAVFLINDTVRAVVGIYDPDEYKNSGKKYMFKTFDATMKVDDFVVVPTDTRHGMTVFKITEVDVDVDFDSPVQYRWIIGKVDRAAYEATLAQEAEAVMRINHAEKTKKRAELRAAMALDAETLKTLPLISSGATVGG